MPSSMPTKMPKSVMFRTGPLIMVPTGYFSLASSQGLAMTSFNPTLQLNESSIVHQTYDFALDPGTHGISLGDGVPGIGSQLFHAKGDSLLLGIELQHHNLYLLCHLHQLRRMIDPPPRHVADVQDTIDTT